MLDDAEKKRSEGGSSANGQLSQERSADAIEHQVSDPAKNAKPKSAKAKKSD